jgi:hypothetical protein
MFYNTEKLILLISIVCMLKYKDKKDSNNFYIAII